MSYSIPNSKVLSSAYVAGHLIGKMQVGQNVWRQS